MALETVETDERTSIDAVKLADHTDTATGQHRRVCAEVNELEASVRNSLADETRTGEQTVIALAA